MHIWEWQSLGVFQVGAVGHMGETDLECRNRLYRGLSPGVGDRGSLHSLRPEGPQPLGIALLGGGEQGPAPHRMSWAAWGALP